MSKTISPMLAVNCSKIDELPYPQLCTPKLDGIRCLIIGTKERPLAVTRKFKPIPNVHVRNWLESHCLPGLDGELMLRGSNNFQAISSAVMSRDGEPDFVYNVFDLVTNGDATEPYSQRMVKLEKFAMEASDEQGEHALALIPVEIKDRQALECFERQCLAAGYEGVMMRCPGGPYKWGRSTENEGYLLKLKRFEDAEAIIIGFEERMHNGNEAESDAFGKTKRSLKKEGMSPMGTLGSLLVKDIETGIEFSIGTGFDDILRANIWMSRIDVIGKIVKYKSQPTGVKEKPRFPVFLGFRDARDM